jgi:hypothetical protein
MADSNVKDVDRPTPLTSSNEITHPTGFEGKFLVRCRGYSIADTAPDTLPGKGFFIRDVQVVPLAQLSQVIDAVISKLKAVNRELVGEKNSPEGRGDALQVGFIPSSIEVIQHLQQIGYNPVASVSEGAPRIAVITSFMVKTKKNPIQDRSIFFVGVAEYPQKRKRAREES